MLSVRAVRSIWTSGQCGFQQVIAEESAVFPIRQLFPVRPGISSIGIHFIQTGDCSTIYRQSFHRSLDAGDVTEVSRTGFQSTTCEVSLPFFLNTSLGEKSCGRRAAAAKLTPRSGPSCNRSRSPVMIFTPGFFAAWRATEPKTSSASKPSYPGAGY